MTRQGQLGDADKMVLQLLAQGLTVHEMAQALSLAPQTIKYHFIQLSRYFGIRPKVAGAHLRAVVWAGLQAGLVEVRRP